MSATVAPVTLGIELGFHSCDKLGCSEIAVPLLNQLSSGYEVCAAMPLPRALHDWRDDHRTARKRADRARARGYWTGDLKREKWADDIHKINVSRPSRQGRPMSAGYRERQEFGALPDYPCSLHAIRTSGVWSADGDRARLCGYLTMYRSGDLVLVSQILGHADHERNEVMYLLFEYALKREIYVGVPAVVVYNRWDSGTDGLRFFKARLGFEEMAVEWLP